MMMILIFTRFSRHEIIVVFPGNILISGQCIIVHQHHMTIITILNTRIDDQNIKVVCSISHTLSSGGVAESPTIVFIFGKNIIYIIMHTQDKRHQSGGVG